MLYLETLMRKRYITKPNNDTIIDLTFSSLNTSESAVDPTDLSILLVSEDEAMRPDLIAKRAYGDDSKLDFLLKYNGVSNPFSLNTGDVLIVPDPTAMGKLFRMPDADEQTEFSTSIKSFNYIDPKTKKDNKRLEMLQKKAANRELLPPNINQEGDKNIKYRDGKIIFGEDVTTVNKANCPETLTRARIKEKLMYNQIFK